MTAANRSAQSGSVWGTGQQQGRIQRLGRYVPESMDHPAKMLPTIAAHAIATYTQAGQLVADPMCGIGTTLVEAVHQGRHAIGVEYEDRWAHVAAANLRHARSQGATGTGQVITGDARHLTRYLPEALGRVALVVTSPPYGAMTHGLVSTSRTSGRAGVRKRSHRYSRDPGNLAHQATGQLLDGFIEILTQCAALLRPDGVAVVTTRPFRLRGELIDFPAAVGHAAEQAGLVLADRAVALLCGIRDGRLRYRTSFFQLHEARKLRDRGLPAAAVQHEDVLILRRPQTAEVLPAVSSEAPVGESGTFGTPRRAA